MIGTLQPILKLQPFTRFHEPSLVVERFDILMTRRVNLIDGDMNMHMLCVHMDGAYPLVVGVANACAKLILDYVQYVEGWLLSRRN